MDIGELIEQSHTVAISLSPRPGRKELESACAIFCALRSLGRNVQFGGEHPLPAPFDSIRRVAIQEKTFAVSLKGIAPSISRISYKKDEHDLTLYFTLTQGEISLQNFALKNHPSPDLTIIVGGDSAKDNGPIEYNPHPKISDAQQSLACALSLLSSEIVPATRLLAKILTNLEVKKDANLYLAVITQADFQETRSTPKDFKYILESLKELFGTQCSYLLLFAASDPSSVQGILWTLQAPLQQKILEYGQGKTKNHWVLFSINQTEPQKAKEHILALL